MLTCGMGFGLILVGILKAASSVLPQGWLPYLSGWSCILTLWTCVCSRHCWAHFTYILPEEPKNPGFGSAISGLSCEATVHPGKSPWSPKLSDWRECVIWCSGTISAKWDKVTMIEKARGGTRARRQIPMDSRLWAPCWLPKLPMESNDCFKEDILCWVKQGWLWPRQ